MVGHLKAAEYPHYFFAITLQALLDSSEHRGGLSFAVWLGKEERYSPLLPLLANNKLQHHHPQSMTIIGDSTSYANVNQLPHCDHTWGVSDDGVVSPHNGKSHIMALSVAGGEPATLGVVAMDRGNLKSVIVPIRRAQILSFNGLHFITGGSGDSMSARVH